MALAGTLVIGIQARVDQLEKDLAKARAEIHKTKTSVVETQTTFQRLGTSLTGLAAGALSIGALTSAVKGLITTGIELKNLQTSFALISGSADKGKQEFAFLRDTANSLGIDIKSLSGDYRSLTASTRGTNVEGEQTRQLFTQLTSASRNYGMSSEQTSRAVQAFSQIISKGKVEQEELRGQLSEAIPGAMQIAARAFGVGTAALGDLVEKGLDASKFVKAFTEQLSREAPASTEIAGKGLAQLGNEIFELKGRIANSGLIQLFDELAAKGAELLRTSRLAAEEATRAGKAALGAAADFATAAEVRAASALQAEQAQEPGAPTGFFSFLPQFSGINSPGRKIAQLRAELERRKGDKATGDAALLEAGLAPSQQSNRAAMEAIEAQQEAIRNKEKFAEIDARTDRRIKEQEKAASEAKTRANKAEREAEAAKKKAAQEAQERLQTEIDNVFKNEQQQSDLMGTLQELPKTYTTLKEARDADRASLLESQLAGTVYEAPAKVEAQRVRDSATMLEQVPALTAIADRTYAEEMQRRAARESLEHREELLGLGPDRFAREYLKVKGELAPLHGVEGVDQARLQTVLRQYEPTFRRLTSIAEDFSESFLETIGRATTGGIKSFKEFGETVLQDMQRLLHRQFLAPALTALVQQGVQAASTFVGSYFGATSQAAQSSGASTSSAYLSRLMGNVPGKAAGGPVMPNRFYVVGEQGPELLHTGGSGSVVPNHALGGTTVTMNVYTQDAGSFQRSAREIQSRLSRMVEQSRRP